MALRLRIGLELFVVGDEQQHFQQIVDALRR